MIKNYQNIKNNYIKLLQKTNSFLVAQLNNTFQDSNCIIQEQNSKESIGFIFWNDFWNHFGIYGDLRETKKDTSTFKRYSIGRKVFADLGYGNIGKELSMPHPAIVLYNFAETVIIVPTTSDDGNSFSEEMERAIIRCTSDKKEKESKNEKPIFPFDTVINLHQIRVIHKNRIINDLKCNIEDYLMTQKDIDWLNNIIKENAIPYGINLRECIRLKIMHLFSREEFFDYIRIKKQNEVYNIKIKEYINDIKNIQNTSNKEIEDLIKNLQELLTNE